MAVRTRQRGRRGASLREAPRSTSDEVGTEYRARRYRLSPGTQTFSSAGVASSRYRFLAQAVVGAADLRAAAQPAFRPTRACRSLSSDFQGRWTALSALSAGSGTNPLPGRTEHALALRRASATRRPMSGLGVPRCCRRSDVTRALLTKISPSSGCSNPASSISVVALPEPDGPS